MIKHKNATIAYVLAPDKLGRFALPPSFTKRVTDVLHEQYDNTDFSCKEMASRLFMSSMTLNRKIKKAFGVSPVKLIRQYRLKQAQKMIAGGQQSITMIAYDCGFKDPAHFSRSFRAEYGQSPSVYAQKMQEK